MILQALTEYYQRKASDQDSNIAPEGWEWKEIPFLILINEKGEFLNLIDTRESENENKKGKKFLVPRAEIRSGSNAWQKSNILWDHYGYLLGYPKSENKKDVEMAKKQLNTFYEKIKELQYFLSSDVSFNAVKNFYNKNQIEKVFHDEKWPECCKISGCNMSFCINNSESFIFNSSLIKDHVNSQNANVSNEEDNSDLKDIEGICLITGERGFIKRTHGRTPINKDTKSLVAIQKSSGYDSYGKSQGFNAPVGKKAEFAYTTALNTLLKSYNNRFQLADASVVFWAEKKSDKSFDLESNFKWYFDDSPKDDPDRSIRSIKALYNSPYTGKQVLDDDTRFYILGLSPNSARISIRIWKCGTCTDFSNKIREHFDDFEIVKGVKDAEFLSLGSILRSVVLEYKSENIPPNLAGKVIESVLDGTPYPETLPNLCINRIRAERHVTRARAAIIKAYINRYNRYYNKNEQEVSMSLDRSNNNIGYRLGRLFAVLEKIDDEGGSGTIRERFYSAASTSPVAVFSRLLTLKNHHLAKIENQGRVVNFEKELGEVFEGINDFPSHMTLREQGLFAVGYYHQRQDYYTSKKENKGKEI